MTRTKESVKIKKNSFEKAAWAEKLVIAGIDEVGRGCLAGPVVAAAVILPPKTKNSLLQDSKTMTPEQRLKAYAWIKKNCWFGVGIIHNRLIDKHNIWQSTLMAMKKALLNMMETCPHKPSAIIIDAMPLKLNDTSLHDTPVHYFNHGESKSISIAAASIVAKVTRDNLMEVFDTIIPGYQLAQHKGYSTPGHKKILKNSTLSIIHRINFVRTILAQKDEINSQLSLNSIISSDERIDNNEAGEILCGSD